MPAPNAYVESRRRKPVEHYSALKTWEERSIFRKFISSLRKSYGVTGVSISLLDKNRQIIKYQTLLDMLEIPRIASLDAHALLSHEYFLLSDASKDWRTAHNPFVSGVPYIKFYCGVPLITSKNDVIGVLAVYDPFSKQEFSEEKINKLIATSKEIMKVLDTPLDELNSSNKQKVRGNDVASRKTELAELALKFGRATSRGSSMTVFEKDGSGGPYFQNNNFRFTKLNQTKDTESVNNKVLYDKLFNVGSLKNAAYSLAKTISINFKINFVYILEIRIAEPYQIDGLYFPQENKIDAENFKYTNKLVKTDDEDNDFITRIIGMYGSSNSALNFENLIHYKAFTSEFGIQYKNTKENSLYNSGIIMPFYRHNSKLVRKNKINNNPGSKKPKKVKLYLRSGGYLIALFNKPPSHEFNSDSVSRIFDKTSILRRIYITS
ncbi:Piso0_002572 [Millerozyma farinosa CBS 7064]|uniref:Piso0_002572 protein n=1 Tax=Pichia sorbitophila (strain ATCC MYA-4447 / BCRC 22081 / CBS 7064 / NBRC 10061 / NRRL Y-12695) TaxID=559304 RepID=G8YCZ1_PICSO|nr:Piso0_002572 [Millerozyma farinosa CBS 7064]